eukprot:Hpha_TRINITY_DN14421_c0_g1::TRINITY_DN14421_c0_g1_i1::g.157417::m.157417
MRSAIKGLCDGNLEAARDSCIEVLDTGGCGAAVPQDATRIIRMIDGAGLPEPYERRYLGWQEFSMADLPEELCEAGVHSGHREVSTKDPSPTDEVATVLREEIRVAQQNRSSLSEDSSLQTSGAPPIEWTDPRGGCWTRADKMLGRGAFGEVWLGMGGDGVLCAVKIVRLPRQPSVTSPQTPAMTRWKRRKSQQVGNAAELRALDGAGELELENLIREIGFLERLRHENIVTFYSGALVSGHVMLSMEYVAGGSMDTILRAFSALPRSCMQHYAREIARGLAFLHENEIVHRDLKTGNVLLQVDGSCKIADFGASGELKQIIGRNELVGTPFYMAPEACLGFAVKASDIWSYGIIVAEMLTGRLPYKLSATDFVIQRFVYLLGHDEKMSPGIPPTEEVGEDAAELLVSCFPRDAQSRPTASGLLKYRFLMG